MKALVYEGPCKLAYRDAPKPEPEPGEALVKIHAVGLCGSDMHAYHGSDERRPPPLILGHEAAGVVEETGRRVAINPLVSCLDCPDCKSGRTNICANRTIMSMPPRQGSFAEWATAPEHNLITVPDHVSLEKAALIEPIACGWHAVGLAEERMRRNLADTEAVVIGGGAIGVGVALSLRAKGVEKVSILETNPVRIPTLERLEGIEIGDPDTCNGTPHLVVDAYGGEQSRTLACALVQPGGVIVHIGLASDKGGIDARRLTLWEIEFVGTYTYTEKAFNETAEAIFDGRLGTLDWTETIALADAAQAFRDHDEGRMATPKTIFKP